MKKRTTIITEMYQHLLTGIGFMIPFVITGGIASALAFLSQDALKLVATARFFEQIGRLGMLLMWPAVAGGMSFAIAKRPGLVAGTIAGFLANEMNTAFFGAAIGGFLAGYSVLFLIKVIKVPATFSMIKETMLIPILSTFLTVFTLTYLLGTPLTFINNFFTAILTNLSDKNPLLLGAVIGLMMIVDLAGPIGKSAYFFGVTTLSDLSPGMTSPIMGAVMIAGMVPPLSLALAITLGKKYFPPEDVESHSMLWVLGATFVTESVIGYAVKDLARILPAFILGSVLASSLSMYFNCGISLPHGGLFAMMIPGAVSHLGRYLLALLFGILVSTTVILLLKKGKRDEKI